MGCRPGSWPAAEAPIPAADRRATPLLSAPDRRSISAATTKRARGGGLDRQRSYDPLRHSLVSDRPQKGVRNRFSGLLRPTARPKHRLDPQSLHCEGLPYRGLDAPLVEVPRAGRMAVRVPPLRVSEGQPAHEERQVAVSVGPEQEVEVIGHQAIAE